MIYRSILGVHHQYSVCLGKSGNEKLGFVRKGRKIIEVHESSPAGKNGKIMAGDEIVAINQKLVTDTDDISSLLRNSDSSIIITFKKKGNYLFSLSVLNIIIRYLILLQIF